jgi:hypothetical protein
MRLAGLSAGGAGCRPAAGLPALSSPAETASPVGVAGSAARPVSPACSPARSAARYVTILTALLWFDLDNAFG